MDRTQLYHGLSLVLGTLIAFGIGLVGPTLADTLTTRLPPGIERGGAYGLAALFIIGVIGGAFGRGGVGLLALWVGLVLAAARPLDLLPAGLDGLAAVGLTLAVAAVGYAIARAVDPFWGSEPGPGQRTPAPLPTSGSTAAASAPMAAPPDRPAAVEDSEPFRPR